MYESTLHMHGCEDESRSGWHGEGRAARQKNTEALPSNRRYSDTQITPLAHEIDPTNGSVDVTNQGCTQGISG